jgi:O-antigen ligase
MPRARRIRRVDLVGVGLAAALAAWVLAVAAVNDGSRPWPSLLAVLGASAAFGAGRAVRRTTARGPVGPTVALAALGGAVGAFATVLDVGAAGGGPLGYGNANGALFAALAFAVVVVRVTAAAPTRRTREAAAVLAIGAALACASTGSTGAVVAAAVGALVAGACALAGARWAVTALAGAALVAATGIVFALALGAGPDAPGTDSFGTRVRLWRGTAELVADHRATGVGPGRFQVENPVSTDADLRRAHAASLQVAAELGVPGLALFLALGGWVVAALWAVRDEPGAAVGAAAFIAIGLQSAFDWVLAEPSVLLLTAAVIGAATTSLVAPAPGLPRRLPRSNPRRRWR